MSHAILLAKCKICISCNKLKKTDSQNEDLLERTSSPPDNAEKSEPLQKAPLNQHVSTKNLPSIKPTLRKREGLPLEQDMNSTKKFKSEKRPDLKQRFSDVKHLPVIDKSKLVRCKKEGCEKKSYVFCSDCKVHLCLNIPSNRNCFKDFHEQ